MYNIEYQKHFSIQSFALCIILQETCDMSHVIPIGSVGGLTWFGRNFHKLPLSLSPSLNAPSSNPARCKCSSFQSRSKSPEKNDTRYFRWLTAKEGASPATGYVEGTCLRVRTAKCVHLHYYALSTSCYVLGESDRIQGKLQLDWNCDKYLLANWQSRRVQCTFLNWSHSKELAPVYLSFAMPALFIEPMSINPL